MKRFKRGLCLLAYLAALGSAAAHEYYGKGSTLVHPWAEPSAPAATSAEVFMHFDNVEQPDRLLRADSELAERVEVRGRDGKPASKGIEIGPQTVLKPGGARLVLIGLKQPLETGRSYPLALTFEKSGTMRVMVSIGAH
jgi:copper(I)-binding protein